MRSLPDFEGAAATSWLVRALVLSLAVAILLFGAYFWLRSCAQCIATRWQVDSYEPAVLDIAARFADGLPVYKPIEEYPFVAPIYTPLFMWLNAVGIDIWGIAFWQGRAVSTLATLATAVTVALIVRARGGQRLPAAAAALLFLLFPPVAIWAPLYRVDMLAVCFATAGLCAYLRRRPGWAVVLFACALATKQSMVSAPLVAGLGAFAERDWRTLRVFALGGVLAAMAVAGLDAALGHQLYLHNVAYLRQPLLPFSVPTGVLKIAFGYTREGLVVGLASLTLLRSRRRAAAPVLLYGGVSLLFAVYTCRKVGSAVNYFVEPCAGLAACIGLGVSRFEKGWSGVAAAVLLFALAWLTVFSPGPFLSMGRPYTTGPLGVAYVRTVVDQKEGERLLHAVQETPSDVISPRQDVILLAGKHLVLEPWLFNQFVIMGIWDQRRLVARLQRGEIGLVMLIAPADVPMYDGLFTAEMRAAVRDHYRLVDQVGRFHLYRPAA